MEYSKILWTGYYGIVQIIVIPLYSREFQNIPECYNIFKNTKKIFENILEYSGIIGKLLPSSTVQLRNLIL